jgi:molecular chaperone Hsp33
MPQADEELAGNMEERVTSLPSLGEVFTEEKDPETLVATAFQGYSPRLLANRRIEFMCHCSPERVRNLLLLLPTDELKDIRDKGPFPVEINCHYCNTPYQFTKEDILEIYAKRYPKN